MRAYVIKSGEGYADRSKQDYTTLSNASLFSSHKAAKSDIEICGVIPERVVAVTVKLVK